MARSPRPLGVLVIAVTVLAAAALVILTNARADKPDTLRDSALRQEEAIADCMRQRGFAYVATVPPDVIVNEAVQRAAANGEDQVAAASRAQARAPEDPNKAVVASLPPAQQQAWGDALWGADTTQGCYDLTFKEAWGADLKEQIARADETAARTRAEPTVIAAAGTYLACMGSRGFPIVDVDTLNNLIDQATSAMNTADTAAYTARANAADAACRPPYQKVYDDTLRSLTLRANRR